MIEFEKLFATTSRQDWATVTSDIKKHPDYLNNETLLRHLFLALIKTGAQQELGELLQALSYRSPEDQILDKTHADAPYYSALRFLFPEALWREVSQLNSTVVADEDMQTIITQLLSSDQTLRDYLETRADIFRARFAREFKYLQAFTHLNIFPYKYLVDYHNRNHAPKSAFPAPLSIDFIYCIKNRVQRTALSLRSLNAAYANYRRNGGDALSVRAMVVEDVSPHILDLTSEKLSTIPVAHHLLETGIGWTRSGLLNFGVKRSKADLLAFVDADFLFHEGFFGGLERALQRIDLSKNAIAVNLVETEAHRKDGKVYSQASPYSYMWMAPSKTVTAVTGFDEGYSGHGFEDRDFEMKLTRAGGLTICDTISIDPECFVLHLSHVVRTGDEKRSLNKERYISRRALQNTNDLLQAHWGEFPVVSSVEYSPAADKIEHAGGLVDFLFFPHNEYHGRTFLNLREALGKQGYSAALVGISPPHPNEGAVISEHEGAYVPLSDVASGKIKARAIACMNDWEGKVVRHVIDTANQCSIATIGIVEGVNDFDDVDTGMNRTAYTRVRHLLLNGEFDRKYFKDCSQDVRVAGIQRIDTLQPGMRKQRSNKRPIALVNVNFSYGVLTEYRDRWLQDIADACKRCGFEMITSQHHADNADLTAYNRSDRPLYDLLAECDVFISRFSGAILEALAMGVSTIYYNSGFEKVDKFMEPLGAYAWAKSPRELTDALRFIQNGGEFDSQAFMAAHCDIAQEGEHGNRSSIAKTTEALIDVVHKHPPLLQRYTEFRAQLREKISSSWDISQPRKPAPLQSCKTLYMVISCRAYTERHELLEPFYREQMKNDEQVVFILGGAQHNYFDASTRILHLKVGDKYEDLPEKVLKGIEYCSEHFDFEKLIKVDDDVLINFKALHPILKQLHDGYFGKMVPSKRGAKPSPTWHFGKVAPGTPFYNKKFVFDGGPDNWAAGGMYLIDKNTAKTLSHVTHDIKFDGFLYEDHMIGVLASSANIDATFAHEHPACADITWMVQDLRDVTDDEIDAPRPDVDVSKIISVHCGNYPPFYEISREKCVYVMRKFLDAMGY